MLIVHMKCIYNLIHNFRGTYYISSVVTIIFAVENSVRVVAFMVLIKPGNGGLMGAPNFAKNDFSRFSEQYYMNFIHDD